MGTTQADPAKMKEIVQQCALVKGLCAAANDSLRPCMIDLNKKIQADNMGTRSHKDGIVNNLANSFNCINEISELADSIMTTLNGGNK